ncbi:MAG: MFS transporter [Candidatus Aminicenantes bacterium RBG_13_64_14]|nr:MAG: MFS transporter [Candidatus Aminicenantes bacterium RBG_13_64_14]
MNDKASVPPSSEGAPTRHYGMVALIFLTFFVISLVTNVISTINPDVGQSFGLNLTLVGLLAFAFFIAYGVMSIPAGMLLERFREKPVMIAAFSLAVAGAMLISLFPSYPVFLLSLFLIGAGMAALQVAINPLLRVSGGEEHFAFNSVMAQLIFGSASFLSPFIYSYFVRNIGQASGEGKPLIGLMSKLVPADLPWVSVYWIFAVILVVMVVVMTVVRFPSVIKKEEERAGAWATHKTLFKNKVVLLYFLGIFTYVGTEQGVSFWLSKFLKVYHGYDPQTIGARRVALFWLLMTVGGILGLILLKLFESRKVLVGFAVAALIFLSLALFGPGPLALVMFPLMGFAASVMWPIIFSLALNSVSSHHGSFSGILCTGIIGGALVPPVIGALGDAFGLRQGMFFLYLTLGYILSIGLWAKPIILNETIAMKKKREAA